MSEAVETIDDAFLDEVAITGTPEAACAQLDEIRTAGVDLPIVRLPINVDDQELVEETFETFAPE